MKALLVGFGRHGDGWYRRLKDRGLLAGVVEKNAAMRSKMGDDKFPFYESLEEAFDQEEIDFIVNVTPPTVHTSVNRAAFERRIPVLCEKPIANEYEEAIDVVRLAGRDHIPFMIAENYRCMPYVRRMKELIDAGIIGELSVIDIGFYRYHRVKRNYPVHLLRDIGIHHMDMVRYLTGKEGKTIQAHLYNPPGGWIEDGAILNASMFIELEDGITVNYSASIASRALATPWAANWRIEGTRGAMELIDQEIYVTVDNERVRVDTPIGVVYRDSLQEFLDSLIERRDGETSGKDYLLTETLVHYAELSNEAQRKLDIEFPNVHD